MTCFTAAGLHCPPHLPRGQRRRDLGHSGCSTSASSPFGAATTITEWKKIAATTKQKILYTFTFPLFLFTYVPIAVVALVSKVEWKPIKHTAMSAAQAPGMRSVMTEEATRS